jgi:hypothetical protein
MNPSMTEATSRSGRTIKPSFKRKAAELGDTPANASQNVFRKKRKENGEDMASPTEDPPTLSPNDDVSSDGVSNTPQVTPSTPNVPQVIDLVDLDETTLDVRRSEDEAKLGKLRCG